MVLHGELTTETRRSGNDEGWRLATFRFAKLTNSCRLEYDRNWQAVAAEARLGSASRRAAQLMEWPVEDACGQLATGWQAQTMWPEGATNEVPQLNSQNASGVSLGVSWYTQCEAHGEVGSDGWGQLRTSLNSSPNVPVREAGSQLPSEGAQLTSQNA